MIRTMVVVVALGLAAGASTEASSDMERARAICRTVSICQIALDNNLIAPREVIACEQAFLRQLRVPGLVCSNAIQRLAGR